MSRFSDWLVRGPAGPEPDLGAPIKRGTEARLDVEPGAPLTVQIARVRPARTDQDPSARRKAELVAQAAAMATRKTQQFADDIVATIDDRDGFTNPAQDLALFDEATKGLK